MSTHVETSSVPSSRGLYTRKATGLVREASFLDTVFFNWAAAGGVGLAIVYSIPWALYAFPGVNLIFTMVLAVPLALAGVFTFALLSSAMPRSGGDYVFVSRILNPLWGFISSWTEFISVVSYMGFIIYFASAAFIAPALGVLGYSTSNSALINLSGSVGQQGTTLAIGTVILLITGVIAASGIKLTLRVLNIVFLLALAGLILTMFVILASSHAAFIAHFDAFARPFTHKSNSYQSIINLATKDSFAIPSHPAFASTVLPALPIMFYTLGYAIWSVYMGGEIKGGSQRNRQLLSMAVPTLLNSALLIFVFALLFNVVGYRFLSATTYIYTYYPSQWPLPVPPYPNLFSSVLAGSGFLNSLIAIAWVAWPIPMMLLILVQFTRQILAWSLDGIVPSQLAYVSNRTHTPVVAIGVSLVASWIALYLMVYTNVVFTFLAIGLLLSLVMFFSVAAAGFAFPWVKREMYQSSPARLEIAGIPVISIAGAILGLFVMYELYAALKYPTLGITDLGTALKITLGTIGAAVAIFALSWLIRSSRGQRPDLIYKEIPPE